MRFAWHHTQETKGLPFANALIDAGHLHAGLDAEVFLVDLDIEPFHGLYEHRLAGGCKVIVIPHGQNASYIYDGILPWDPRTTAHFVIGEGQREVLRRMGVDAPSYTTGWPWCELHEFRASAEPRKVLFAPCHPVERNNFMPDRWRDLHKQIFAELLELDIDLTVRHIGDLETNGLWEAPGVTYSTGRTDNATTEIDGADLVIGMGTFASLAVARGVPTITFGSDFTPWNQLEDDGPILYVQSWDAYREYVRFPHEFGDEPLGGLIRKAAASDDGIREWRDLFIGEQFDPARFACLVDELSVDPFVEAEVRSEIYVAFADEIADDPALLTEYAHARGPAADATLLLYAPDKLTEDVVEPLTGAIAAAGLDDANSPDMLIVAIAKHEAHERTMAERAAGLLSRREDVDGRLGALPRVLGGTPLAARA